MNYVRTKKKKKKKYGIYNVYNFTFANVYCVPVRHHISYHLFSLSSLYSMRDQQMKKIMIGFDDRNSLSRMNSDVVMINDVCLIIFSFFLNHNKSYNVVVKEELIVLNDVECQQRSTVVK